MGMINKEDVFEYLDELRESGITNMFGAAPYVAEEFNIEKEEARKYLTEWMESFGKRN